MAGELDMMKVMAGYERTSLTPVMIVLFGERRAPHPKEQRLI